MMAHMKVDTQGFNKYLHFNLANWGNISIEKFEKWLLFYTNVYIVK